MNSRKFKGASVVISSIMLIGVLLVITSIAYTWGMPMIQRNMDKPTLYKAENFLTKLDKKVDEVAKLGSIEEITFNIPGEIKIDAKNNTIEFSVQTETAIYGGGQFICFSKSCNTTWGEFGIDSYSVTGAYVHMLDDYASITTYKIIYRNLTKSDGSVYLLDIVTVSNATIIGSENSKIVISKIGEERGALTKTLVLVDIR